MLLTPPPPPPRFRSVSSHRSHEEGLPGGAEPGAEQDTEPPAGPRRPPEAAPVSWHLGPGVCGLGLLLSRDPAAYLAVMSQGPVLTSLGKGYVSLPPTETPTVIVAPEQKQQGLSQASMLST